MSDPEQKVEVSSEAEPELTAVALDRLARRLLYGGAIGAVVLVVLLGWMVWVVLLDPSVALPWARSQVD
jgi:hypothetical protein